MAEGRECAYDSVSGTQEAKSVVVLQKNSEILNRNNLPRRRLRATAGVVRHAGTVLETCVRAGTVLATKLQLGIVTVVWLLVASRNGNIRRSLATVG